MNEREGSDSGLSRRTSYDTEASVKDTREYNNVHLEQIYLFQICTLYSQHMTISNNLMSLINESFYKALIYNGKEIQSISFTLYWCFRSI